MGGKQVPVAQSGSWASLRADLAVLITMIRTNKGISRGQLARRMKLSPTVVYNLETNRTRIDFQQFVDLIAACGFKSHEVLARHLFSVTGLESLEPALVVKAFRNRLQISQNALATKLGYKSGSMIHHFEKGIRLPSIYDYIKLMELAGDNVRGLVLDLTGDESFSLRFAAGEERREGKWTEYWENYYIPAIRQMMRAKSYKDMKRYNPGFFSDILGIPYSSEQHALAILKDLDLIFWENAKPEFNSVTKIIIPKDIPKEKLDNFKFQWIKFSRNNYLRANPDHVLNTLDLLPVNEKIFKVIKARIRALQDEIHNMRLTDTDGFVYLGWLANYIPI